MQNKFSIYLTGFRKNHSTQYALLKMDLSKAFDSVNHKLIIAKSKS